MNALDKYNEWLVSPYIDEQTKAELRSISGDEKEIDERFYKDLEFGTAGLRGVLGAGANRMNIYTVGAATQGLANYILQKHPEAGKGTLSAVIAHDSRRMSPEFALRTALIFCANGIKAYLFESLRPTPELSFAVRHLKCSAGVVVTASHNPPEYNGYKAYWSDGGQIPYPMDEEIIKEVEKITSFNEVKTMERAAAEAAGLLVMVGKDVDDEFIKNVKSQSVNPDAIQKTQGGLKIVYTPLHGAGNIPVRRVLKEVGFTDVAVVPEQEAPDADFTTVEYPNPEDPKAFALALKLGKETGADLLVATDPDSDRIGVVVKHDGEYRFLTGNMMGVLLCEYILSQKKVSGSLPANAAVISTIVSTDLTKAIAKNYGVKYFEVLTGFKYIGEKIKKFEQTGSYKFVFGFEESYGYLAGTYARDKDAVVAAMLACEMAAYYKTRGMTLWDGLNEIYAKYGYYKEAVRSVSLPGIEGLENMKRVMAALRENPLSDINGAPITERRDYLSKEIIGKTGKAKTDLPVSDVLYYAADDGSWLCVRPSGTEPKIKIYIGVKAGTDADAQKKIDGAAGFVTEMMNGYINK